MVPDRLALREATILECAARGDRGGAHDALALGLREARLGHAPLMALSLRLTAAECRAGGADGYTLRRWLGASLPAMYRRRLNALVLPDAAPARDADAPLLTPADVIALVQVFNEAADERSALEHACVHVRDRLGIAAVSVFAWRHGQALLLANAGLRPCDAVAAARAAERGAAWHDGAAGEEVFAAIRWAGEVAGVAAARGLAGTTAPAGAREALLAALTSAAAASVRALGDALGPPFDPPGTTAGILGVSRAVAVLRGLVMRAGATSFPVLIEGESGTGKELAAKAVHLASERRGRRFCAVNCAALSEDLLEAELFGHARGAFTGASSDRPGLFEEADGGTLFLDEISELSPRGQAKLLRAIQEREIRRVGENNHRRVDVRIVCATNRPLGDEVVAGRFRQDLFYRLDVVRIHVPPLRERPEDIPLLADRFWREALAQTGGRAILSSETVAALAGRPWPGNIRELQNTLAALAVRAPRHGRIGPRDLAWLWPDAAGGRPFPRTLDDARRAFEAEFVRSVLDRAGGRRCRAAAELGVTRQGLAKLVTRLGITQTGRTGAAWGGAIAPEGRASSQAAVQREERGVLRKHDEAPRHGG
jgi:DNA-binding NtrC family response regulator